jgi:DNA modification methylase
MVRAGRQVPDGPWSPSDHELGPASRRQRHGSAGPAGAPVQCAPDRADTRVVYTTTAPNAPRQSVTVLNGDALRELPALATCSVDAVISDPPYAIGAIGDYAAPLRTTTANNGIGLCDRCGDPRAAGYLVCEQCLDEAEIDAYASSGMLGQQSQNWHVKATHSRGYADNDPVQFGRWCAIWLKECLRILKPGGHLVLFGGTRTWHRLAVAVEDTGFEVRDTLAWVYASGFPKSVDVASAIARHPQRQPPPSAQHDIAAAEPRLDETPTSFEGWGTSLKPAHEPIVLARKPLTGTVARNVLTHGTGALNITATRVEGDRWPTNVFFDAHQARVLDAVAGQRASRFFWVAKPDKRERVRVDGHSHPTVKPLTLMRELVRLVTPPNGLVLDPFAGSGTTAEACLLEGYDSIVIERDPAFVSLIEHRILRRTDPVKTLQAPGEQLGLF